MTTYTCSTDIDAPAEIVSGLLHGMPRWTSWTRTIQEATPLGATELSPGTRVRIRQPGLPVSVWTVDRADETGLEWNNLRHGLRTVAVHRVERTSTGCRLSVQIDQTGVLDLPVRLVYGRLIRRHLAAMAADITAAASGSAIAADQPLGPNRSTLISAGPTPSPSSSWVAASAKIAEPQTK